MVDRLDSVKHVLWEKGLDFCIVYRALLVKGRLELSVYKSVFQHGQQPQERERLLSKYKESAYNCYKHNRDLILSESLADPSSKGKDWLGFTVISGAGIPLPTNAEGKRWWQLIIGSGATRAAGNVIVARIAAKDIHEMQQCISTIQGLMED